MLPDRVSNPGPLTYESGALLIALRGPAIEKETARSFEIGSKEKKETVRIFIIFPLSPSIQWGTYYKASGSFLFPLRFNGGNIIKLLAVSSFPFDSMGEISQSFWQFPLSPSIRRAA